MTSCSLKGQVRGEGLWGWLQNRLGMFSWLRRRIRRVNIVEGELSQVLLVLSFEDRHRFRQFDGGDNVLGPVVDVPLVRRTFCQSFIRQMAAELVSKVVASLSTVFSDFSDL